MKKLFFAIFVIAAMVFLGIGTKSSARINANMAKNTLAFISYQVNIYPDHNLLANTCASFVEITNESGMVIGQPQMYMPGQNTYHFYEMGPVNGTRKATITNLTGNHNSVPCFVISWWDTRTTTFRVAENYIFILAAPGTIQRTSNIVSD